MRNFRELDIWNNSVLLVKNLYVIASNFPSTEKFGLISQINRCAVSIPSNIAEECFRSSQKDFSRFLQISLGSSFELETQIEIAKEVGFLNENASKEIISEINSLQKKIQSLKKYVDLQSDTQKPNA